MNKHTVTLLLFILTLLACSKRDDKTITGRILRKTDSTAYANTSFIIGQYETTNGGKGREKRETLFKTDNNGYFNVTFDSKSAVVAISTPDGGGVVSKKDVYADKFDFGTLYYNP